MTDMSDPERGEPVARSPLPGLPPLDPVPWTGTAAPGNTGRPYGERAEAAARWDAGARQAVIAGGPMAGPGPGGPAGGEQSGPTGHPVNGHPANGHPATADRRPDSRTSARQAGRRALRVALLSVLMGFVALASFASSPGLAKVAVVVSAVASVLAFGSGIAALRQTRRQHVGSGAAAVATGLGAVGLLLVILFVSVWATFPSELTRYVTCTRDAAGSEQQTKVCEQQFLNATQSRFGDR